MDTLPLHSMHAGSGAAFGERGGREVVRSFGEVGSEYEAARRAAVLVDFSFRDALRLTGEDRLTFLHGMCTNDVKALPEWGVNYAAMVTAKGAMVSDARIVRRPADLVLDLEPGQYGKVREFLGRHLVSEDVELNDGRGDFAVLGLVGPRSLEALRAAFGPEPRFVEFDGAQGALLPSLSTRGEGVDLLLPREKLEQAWALLRDRGAPLGLRIAGVDAIEQVRVEDGVPRFGAELLETTIPLEAGLQSAISYNKGCYVGQEVIARATFRGHMNRMLTGLKLGPHEASPGTELRFEGKKVGFLTSVIRSPALGGEFAALGYVHRAHLEPGTRLTVGESDARAEVSALPLGER